MGGEKGGCRKGVLTNIFIRSQRCRALFAIRVVRGLGDGAGGWEGGGVGGGRGE